LVALFSPLEREFNKRLTLAIYVAILTLLAGGANAEVSTAALIGVITDVSGVPIVGVRIDVRSLRTNSTCTVMTDHGGFFRVPNLVPGRYQVVGSFSGFISFDLETSLAAGDQRAAKVRMRVGNGSEKLSGEVMKSDSPTTGVSLIFLVAIAQPARTIPTNTCCCSVSLFLNLAHSWET
jgi:hypothetical protein